MEDATLRFSGLFPEGKHRKYPLVILGLGGIGSFAAQGFAMMRWERWYLVDKGQYEFTNMGTQWCDHEDVGEFKAIATGRKVKSHLGSTLNDVETACVSWEKVIDDIEDWCDGDSPIVVLAIDDMNERKKVFDAFTDDARYKFGDGLLIDGRMAGREGQVISVLMGNDDSQQAWRQLWFPQGEAVQESCTTRATGFCGMGVGAAIVGQALKYVRLIENDVADDVLEKNFRKVIRYNYEEEQ